MTAGGRVLSVAAVVYPAASFALLRMTCGVSGIPGPNHLLMLGFVMPLLAAAVALACKMAGARLPWAGVAAFGVWVGAVGAAHAWLIDLVWASI